MMRRIFVASGYALGAAVIIFGTILLIAFGNGYSYDFKTGRLVHRGLLLLESKPSGGQITVNGKEIKKNTPYRQSYEGGRYDLKVTREGYKTWTKQVEIIPSRVTATQYVLLMPQRFESEEVATFKAVEQFTATRDRSRIAFVVPGNENESGLWVMNAQNQDRKKVYGAPAPAEGQSPANIQIMSWSDDASHLLVRQNINGVFSTLVIDADGGDPTLNLTDIFKADISNVTFSKSNRQELYWISPEGLRRLSLNDQTISAVLVEKIAAYTYAAGDRLLYVDTGTQQPSLWALERNGRKQLIEGNLPVSSQYSVAFSTYINQPQAVVTALDSGKVQLFSDIYGRPFGRTLDVRAKTAAFNGDGRFVVLVDDLSARTFDLELSKLYSLGDNKPMSGLSWYDNYHLQYFQDGKAVIAEYDGNYATSINEGNGQAPINAPNDRELYVVAPAKDGVTQIRLITIRK